MISLALILSLSVGTTVGTAAGMPLTAAAETGEAKQSAAEEKAETAAETDPEEEDFSYEEMEHSDMGLEEMQKSKYDHSHIEELLNEFSDLIKEGSEKKESEEKKTEKEGSEKNEEDVSRLYQEILQEYDLLVSELNVSYIETCLDPNDDKAKNTYEENSSDLTEIQDRIYLALKEAMGSSYKVTFEELLSEDIRDALNEYEPLTEERLAMQEEKVQLENEYWAVIGQEFSCEVDGKTYTDKDLDDLEGDTYDAVSLALAKAKNDAAAPIYKKVVALDNKIAESYGYEDYASYAYENSFGREYSPAEAEQFTGYVKKYLLPMFLVLYTARDEQAIDVSEQFEDLDQEKRLDLLEPYIKEVSPELEEAWNYLRTAKLYDMSKSETKADQGFTIDFPAWNSAFIYDQPDGGMYSYSTIVHEFGHFNAAYHTDEPSLWYSQSYDLAEVQSQGLEMLYLIYWDEVTGKAEMEDAMTLESLFTMLYSVISGCEVNEIERYAHEHPDASIEEWNKAFADIAASYAMNGDTEDGYYSWVEIGHITTSPYYYISYATSAFSALNIWAEAQNDREKAVEDYIKISAVNKLGYKDTLEALGMLNPFEESDVQKLLDTMKTASREKNWFDNYTWNFYVSYLINGGYIDGGKELLEETGEDGGFGEAEEELESVLEMLQESLAQSDAKKEDLMQITKGSTEIFFWMCSQLLLHPAEIGIQCGIVSYLTTELIWKKLLKDLALAAAA